MTIHIKISQDNCDSELVIVFWEIEYVVVDWRKWAIYQVYDGENKLQFVKYIMARTSYNLSGISCREQVTICQVYDGEQKLHFDEIIMMSTL